MGGHIIGWADDWEVSGATDLLTRPELGPWLRGETGPYDGIVGSAVDRIGRNTRDVLNTGDLMKSTARSARPSAAKAPYAAGAWTSPPRTGDTRDRDVGT